MRAGVAKVRTLVGLVLIGGSLFACSKKSEGDPLFIEPRNDLGTNEDKFGKGFRTAFTADPNSEPRNVQEGDLPPISLTTEPLAVD